MVLARIHRGEPAGTGAADQAQQHGLGLIVARVAERDPVGAEMMARAIEEGVARRAPGILDRTPLAARARGHVLPFDQQRHADRFGDGGRAPFVVRRRFAKLVIEVREPDQLSRSLRAEFVENVGERGRVRPARNGRDDARVRRGSDRAARMN